MKSKVLFAVVAVLLTLTLALPAAAKGIYLYNFTESLKPFTASTNDANKRYSFEQQFEGNLLIGGAPNGYAAIKLVPYTAESAAWMIVYLEKGTGPGSEDLNISFDARDLGGCRSCALVAYVGDQAPVKSAQFTTVLSPKDPALAETWQTFSHKVTVKTAVETPMYVAIGWRTGSDMLKTMGAVGFDNVCITMAPTP
jgi:hypothetical protein